MGGGEGGGTEEGAEADYHLHAWVIMPNHVHLLMTTREEQAESYDRVVRSREEFGKVESYILRNPVRAGLAGSVEEYRWSSAWRG